MHEVVFTDEMAARFWAKVDKSSECWIWNGKHGSLQYGQFSLGGYRQIPAHRAAYILTHGVIPEGMYICHHCDNPPCVRPDHLFAGTPSDNTRDMVKKHYAKPRHWRQYRDVFSKCQAAEHLGVTVEVIDDLWHLDAIERYSEAWNSRAFYLRHELDVARALAQHCQQLRTAKLLRRDGVPWADMEEILGPLRRVVYQPRIMWRLRTGV